MTSIDQNSDYAVVFSGGGALCSWEIGAFKAILEKHQGQYPKVVTGSSGGALNASALALGFSIEDLEDLWKNIKSVHIHRFNWKGILSGFFRSLLNIIRLMKFNKAFFEGYADLKSLFDNSPFQKFLKKVFFSKQNELSKPLISFAITLTNLQILDRTTVYKCAFNFKPPDDLYHWKELVDLNHLIKALLGTTAIPGIYPPVDHFVDGGIVRNQPIGPAAILLDSCSDGNKELPIKIYVIIPTVKKVLNNEYRCNNLRFPDYLRATINTWMTMSLDWQLDITDYRNTVWETFKATGKNPDYRKVSLCVIRPSKNCCKGMPKVGLLDFGKKVNDLINNGYETAKVILNEFYEKK